MSLRIAVMRGEIDLNDLDDIRDYETDVPVFDSGAEAAIHGLTELTRPGSSAVKAIDKLRRKRERSQHQDR